MMDKKGELTSLLIGALLLAAAIAASMLLGKPTITSMFHGPATSSSCGEVNESLMLSSDIITNNTCFVINASDLVLDCAGFNVTGNGSGEGINATDLTNITVRNCNVENFRIDINLLRVNDSFLINNTARNSSFEANIYIVSSRNNLITNNTGTSSSIIGIELLSSSNNTLSGNNGTSPASIGILVNGGANNTLKDNIGASTTSEGIRLTATINNTIINNTGTTDSGTASLRLIGSIDNALINSTFISNSSNAINFETSSENNTFFNTTIRTNNIWISTDSDSIGNNFNDTLFDADNGSIRILPNVTIPNGTTINLAKLNISFNNAFLNSTDLTFLNTSAEIILRSIDFANPKPVYDPEDDGSFIDCPASVCAEISFSNNVYIFNVTGFTSYSSNESSTSITSCGTFINSSGTYNVTQNLNSSSENCISINASNVVLNCNGNNITGTGAGSAVHLNLTITNNITIINCVIWGFNRSIFLGRIHNSTIENNTLINGTNGIYGPVSAGNSMLNLLIKNNTIKDMINAFAPSGIAIGGAIGTASNITIINNFINNSGYAGMSLSITNSLVANNTIMSGQPSAIGMDGSSFSHNTIIENYILGSGINQIGLRLLNSAENNTIINNTVNMTATSNTGAISLSTNDVVNNTVVRNMVLGAPVNGISGGQGGNSENFVENNTILSTGTNGIHFLQTSKYRFSGNVVRGPTVGILLNDVDNSILFNNTINDTGRALVLLSNDNNLFNATRIENATILSINLSGGNSNNFTSTTFVNPFTSFEQDSSTNNTSFLDTLQLVRFANFSITYPSAINVSGAIDNDSIEMSTNIAAINTSATPALNNTANISIRVTSCPATIFAFANFSRNRTEIVSRGIECNAGSDPSCTNIVCAANMLNFTASHFSSFASGTACGDVNESTTLINSVSSNGTCFNITASNVVLDCAGFTILYGNASSGFAIIATNVSNITVKDCIITGGASLSANKIGINITNINNSLFLNNTITTNGTNNNHGLLFSNATNNTVANNTIAARGTQNANTGVQFKTESTGNTVIGNSITTNGTTGNYGVFFISNVRNNVVTNNTIDADGTQSLAGVYLATTVSGNNVTGNVISVGGTGNGQGIRLENVVNNNTIADNRVTTRAALGSNRYGIILATTATSNRVINNTVTTDGQATNFGIRLEGAAGNNSIENNTVSSGGTGTGNAGISFIGFSAAIAVSENNATGNTIVTNGSDISHGIRIETFSNNNRFSSNNITTAGNFSYGLFILNSNGSLFNNTILDNPVQWINASSNTFSNLTNTTFSTGNGSVNFANFTLSGAAQDVTRDKFNISFNRVFLNSSNITSLNTSAEITLRGITTGNNTKAIVDLNDNGLFTLCPSSRCTLQSFVGTTFVFNVSSFTTYSTSNESFCGELNESTDLNRDVNSTGTCFTITNSNLILDCSGFTIRGDGTGTGINATDLSNITIENCFIENFSIGILLGGTNNSFLINDTARNISNESILLELSNNNLLENNTGSSTGESGIELNFSNNNTLVNNRGASRANFADITVNPGAPSAAATANSVGDGFVAAFAFVNSSNNTLVNNTGTALNATVFAFLLSSNSNVIRGATATSNEGATFLLSESSYNTIANARGTNADGVAFAFSSSNSNNITNVTGTNGNNTVFYFSSSSNNNITNATSNHTDGSSFFFTSSSDNNTLLDSVITSSNSTNTVLALAIPPDTATTITNSPGSSIHIDGGSNYALINNIVTSVDGAAVGISGGSNNILMNITANTSGNGFVFASSSNNNITNSSATSIDKDAFAFLSSNSNILTDVTGTSSNSAAFSFSGSSGNTITNAAGISSSSSSFIIFSGSNNNVIRNSVGMSNITGDSVSSVVAVGNTATNTISPGANIMISSSSNNSFINGTFTGSPSIDLHLVDSTNISFFNTTLQTNSTWILTGSSSLDNNMTNTLFDADNGSIRILPRTTLPASANVSLSRLNISFNRAFLNSSNLTFLNTSALITLLNIGVDNATVRADFEDDGTFVACPSTICTLINDSSSSFIFNVTGWTTYKAAANNIPTHDTPILNSTFGTNFTNENLTIYPQNVADADGDSVQNITDWRLNNVSISLLNMPFETDVSSNGTGLMRDYSISGNNGTLGGGTLSAMPTWTSSGKVGGAYVFDGDDDFIRVPYSDSLNVSENISVELWLNPRPQHKIFERAIEWGEGAYPAQAWFIVSTGTTSSMEFYFAILNSTDAEFQSPHRNLTASTWNHVVGTFDGSTLRFYINGTEVGSGTSTSGNKIKQNLTDVKLGIGSQGNGGQNFNGTIDEVRIYNRALTSQQILQLYNDGLASHYPQTLVSNELVAGDSWTVAVTPNDHIADGTTRISNTVVIRAIPAAAAAVAEEEEEEVVARRAPVITPKTYNVDAFDVSATQTQEAITGDTINILDVLGDHVMKIGKVGFDFAEFTLDGAKYSIKEGQSLFFDFDNDKINDLIITLTDLRAGRLLFKFESLVPRIKPAPPAPAPLVEEKPLPLELPKIKIPFKIIGYITGALALLLVVIILLMHRERPNKELENYVMDAVLEDVPEYRIVDKLTKAGWDKEKVKQVIKRFKRK